MIDVIGISPYYNCELTDLLLHKHQVLICSLQSCNPCRSGVSSIPSTTWLNPPIPGTTIQPHCFDTFKKRIFDLLIHCWLHSSMSFMLGWNCSPTNIMCLLVQFIINRITTVAVILVLCGKMYMYSTVHLIQ